MLFAELQENIVHTVVVLDDKSSLLKQADVVGLEVERAIVKADMVIRDGAGNIILERLANSATVVSRDGKVVYYSPENVATLRKNHAHPMVLRVLNGASWLGASSTHQVAAIPTWFTGQLSTGFAVKLVRDRIVPKGYAGFVFWRIVKDDGSDFVLELDPDRQAIGPDGFATPWRTLVRPADEAGMAASGSGDEKYAMIAATLGEEYAKVQRAIDMGYLDEATAKFAKMKALGLF